MVPGAHCHKSGAMKKKNKNPLPRKSAAKNRTYAFSKAGPGVCVFDLLLVIERVSYVFLCCEMLEVAIKKK